MNNKRFYHRACYLRSAHTLAQLPPDKGMEVAFAGRSNSGKSSAINAISHQRQLARSSKTPGRTQQIIFFQLDEQRRLVDLPGYGFAQVPLTLKRHWQGVLERYLSERQSLRGLMLMMDCRHPLTELDQQLLAWSQQRQLEVQVLLTKADKLSYQQAQKCYYQVQSQLAPYAQQVQVQLFSALKFMGIERAQARLDHWLWAAEQHKAGI